MYPFLYWKFALLTGFLVLGVPRSCTGESNQDVQLQLPFSFTIELMIVCDKTFSDKFGQDRAKILNYWAVYMSSVQDKFRSLESLNISFKVTSVLVVKKSSEQPFIELSRDDDQIIVMAEILKHFSKWIFSHWKKLDFDIAILITGEDIDVSRENDIYGSYKQGACTVKGGSYNGVMVLDSKYALGYPCGILESGLVNLIAKRYAVSYCWALPYLNSYDKCGPPLFYFSDCVGKRILETVVLETKQCLRVNSDMTNDALKNRTNMPYPLSLTEQCVIITNNINAKSAETGNNCVSANCFEEINGTFSLMREIHPVDGSPCGINKRCHHGQCLTNGYVLQNLATDKCLYARDGFNSGDVVVTSCMRNSSKIHEFMVYEGSFPGKRLVAPLHFPAAGQYLNKCLSLDKTDNILCFKECSTKKPDTLGWDFIMVGDDESDEILLYHRHTNGCIIMQQDFSVNVSFICNKTDSRMHWKLLSKSELPWRMTSKNEAMESSCHIQNVIFIFAVFGLLGILVVVAIAIWWVWPKVWRRKNGHISKSRRNSQIPRTVLYNHENGVEIES